LLVEALAVARAEGYGRVSFSGGEPLLYPGLDAVLQAADRLGMLASLTTNGIPLTGRRLAELTNVVDLIAVSLDGTPARHDAMRGPHTFARMAARLPALRASGIPFGFLFTLTRESLHDLAWVAEFALEQGAKLLQIHPLEEVGRARAEAAAEAPDDLVANAAYLAFLRLEALIGQRITLQLDLAHRGRIREQPWRAYADAAPAEGQLADLLDTLVIEEDGWVVPLQYGLSRSLALGSLHAAPLDALAAAWRSDGQLAFRAHCRRIYDRSLADPEALPAFNWFEALGSS
jgi:MoaA/NifB/PqqE/SkfB family radical SAM enzyme